MTLVQELKAVIENCIDNKKEIALFPFGEIGLQAKLIMKEIYGIEPAYIFDNHVCQYNKNVLPLSEADNLDLDNVVFIFTIARYNSDRETLLDSLKAKQLEYIELDYPFYNISRNKLCNVGRHTYGDIIDTYSLNFCESIGSFSSFAEGTRVVQNHANQYISTSPFIYHNKSVNDYLATTYEENKDIEWYIEGITPKGIIPKSTKSKIGNDVWLGRNVTITNGANIGNGVIAGAGAVITKDVPDYAIVVGAPAKIIRYRYTPNQIEALNRICWWDWTDEEIRERYDDFFLPIDDFIAKYDVKQKDF